MTRALFAVLFIVGCGNKDTSVPPPTGSDTPPPSAPSALPTPSATVSATPSASATAPVASASASAPTEPTFPAFKETMGTAKAIILVWRPKPDQKEGKQVDITTDAAVKGIIDAIGSDQAPSGSVPRCLSNFAFTFQDAAKKNLGTVGLCATDTMSDSMKPYGRIDYPDGKFSGIKVQKYAELQKKLKALGVTLP